MMITVKEKMQRKKLSEDHKIAEARTEVQKAFVIYQQNCRVDAQIELQNKKNTQPAFTCSKLTIETLEQGVKYVQS